MTTTITTQIKMLQDLLAIQQVYYSEFEALDIEQDPSSGEFFVITDHEPQIDSLTSRFGQYPVPLGAKFDDAKIYILNKFIA